MNYTVKFTGKKIESCRDCRFAKQVSKNYWESEIMCSPYKRFINRFCDKNIKPNWCPLKEEMNEN